jgi:RHS repeat-associated protein
MLFQASTPARRYSAVRSFVMSLVAAGSLVFAGQAFATRTHTIVSPPTDAVAANACHDENVSPWANGMTPSAPGVWGSSTHDGEGWDLLYSTDRKQIKVILYIYNEHGQPTWLASKMTAISTDGTWSARLYKYTAASPTSVTSQEVGSAAIRFFENDLSRVAIAWDWDNLGNISAGPQLECLDGITATGQPGVPVDQDPSVTSVGGAPNSIYTDTRANELFSGYWNQSGSASPDQVPGIVFNIVQSIKPIPPTPPSAFSEADGLLTFDASGQPVWLLASISASCSAYPCLPPQMQASGDWLYVTPKPIFYHQGIPLENCVASTTGSGSNTVIHYCTDRQTVGQVTRAITNDRRGDIGSLNTTQWTMLNPLNQFDSAYAQTLSSTNFPGTTTAGIKKITDSTGILPVQYACQVPAGLSTCVIYVPFNVSSGTATAYRHYLDAPGPNGNYYEPLANGAQTGEVYDQLRADDRVAYELWEGDPENGGTLTYQTAEVRAYGTQTNNGDSSDGAAATPTQPSGFSPPALDTSSDLVGAVAGTFRVDESGNANYSIPLVVSPGSGGFSPKLALTYNSGGGMGYLGTGFSLEGLSAITPCRPTKEHGDTDKPTAVASVFCLDGQRLLLQSGTDRTLNATYRTELESFQKVVIQSVSAITVPGMPSGDQSMQTFSFAVYGKDGSVRHYGGVAGTIASSCDSPTICPVSQPQPAVPVTWLETDRTDAGGNTITFNYATVSSPNGERTLSSITYTGGSIQFHYRPTESIDTSYSSVLTSDAGALPIRQGHVQRSQLIDGINIYNVNANASTNLLRHYALQYGDAAGLSTDGEVRPRLINIKECADLLATQCYAPTTFTWADPGASVHRKQSDGTNPLLHLGSDQLGDFNGDHRTDIAWVDTDFKMWVSYSSTISNTDIGFSTKTHVVDLDPLLLGGMWQVMDLDGDGIDDIVYATLSGSTTQGLSGGTIQWNVVYGIAGGGFSAPAQAVPSSGGGGTSTNVVVGGQSATPGLSLLADFDGDGLPDLLWAGPNDSQFHISFLTRTPGAAKPFAFGPRTPVTFVGSDGTTVCNLAGTPGLVIGVNGAENAQGVDVDGDGRADIHIMLQAGDPTNPCNGLNGDTLQLSGTPPTTSGTSPTGGVASYILKSFKNMGIQADGSVRFAMYKWLGAEVPLISDTTNAGTASSRVRFIDLNGDGLVDLIYRDDNRAWYYALSGETPSTGNPPLLHCIVGCTLQSTEDGNALDMVQDSQVQLIDYDGDGKVDFVFPSGPTGTYYAHLWEGNGFASAAAATPWQGAGPGYSRITGDFDGDGMPDILTVSATDGSWTASRISSHDTPRNVITHISNGLAGLDALASGAVTKITYSPLTFSSVYQQDYNAPWLSTYGRGSVVFDVTGPTYVVQYAESSAPTKGNPSDTSIVQYSYRGLKMQAGGRGSLGFRKVTSYDHQSQMQVDTTYSTQFPYVGTPLTTVTSYVPNAPADPCLSGGADAPTCIVRTPVCAGGFNVTCDAPLPAGSQTMKTVTDTWLSRIQPTAPADGHFVTLGTSSILPPATLSNQIRANTFTARTLSQTSNFDFGSVPMTQETTSFDVTKFDDLGNPQRSSSTKAGSVGGVTTTITTTSLFAYYNDVANWKLGRLLTASVFNQRSNGAVTARRSSFCYFSVPSALCDSGFNDSRELLRSERVEGMTGPSVDNLNVDPEPGSVTKYYDYDVNGNKTATYTCSTGSISELQCRSIRAGNSATAYVFHPVAGDRHNITRYTRSLYDSQNRFVNQVYEGISTGGAASTEQLMSEVTVRDIGGQPKTSYDINRVRTEMLYGVMGRKQYEWNTTGASTQLKYSACSASSCPAGYGLAYSASISPAGAPSKRIYYDILGRKVIDFTQGFAASDYYTSIAQYDERGNVAWKSQPFFAAGTLTHAATPAAGVSTFWTHTEFDALNRPWQITNPDGGLLNMSYSGLQTTTTLPANNSTESGASHIRQSAVRTVDPLGNLMSSTDPALGITVTYDYDAVGSQTSVSHGGIITKTKYDALGRKRQIDDPDTGTRIFTPNDMGETIQQSTAMGTCTQILLDARGRHWQTFDYAAPSGCSGAADTVSEWDFDTSADGFGKGKLAEESTVVNGITKVSKNYTYDGVSHLRAINTSLDGKSYTDQTNFDQLGRKYQTFFTASGLRTTGELYVYNLQGYSQQIQSAYPGTSGVLYYQVQGMDPYGHVTQEQRSSLSPVVTEKAYDAATGRVNQIQSGGGYLQNLNYTYDLVGNMTSRDDDTLAEDPNNGHVVREVFAYDGLQRLVSSTVQNNGQQVAPNLAMAYDNEGNISSKVTSFVQSAVYHYGEDPTTNGCSATAPSSVKPGPHAVTSYGYSYCYDKNGNVIAGGAQSLTISYTPYDLPSVISSTHNNVKSAFEYGPEHEKIRRVDYSTALGSAASAVTHYVGSAEVRYTSVSNQAGALVEVRRYLGPVILVQDASQTIQRQYLLTDAQGSTAAVLTEWGARPNDSAVMSFDPFGARRDPGTGVPAVFPWTSALQQDLDATTHDGYTGHEQLDKFGIIHMGGRIYDPNLGRFLQADPYVQDPTNSQSFNRYSYVLNNPMSMTDPSGYFSVGDLIRDIIAGFIAYETAGIATGLLDGSIAGAAEASAVAFVGGYASGAVQTGSSRGAMQGAVSSLVFFGVEAKFGGNFDLGTTEGIEAYAEHALVSGVAGGVLAQIQGGRFGSGFLSAGFNAALTPLAAGASGSDAGRGFVVALIGGTASSIGGGKFANGAISAAFSYALGRLPTEQTENDIEEAREPDGIDYSVRKNNDLASSGAISVTDFGFFKEIDITVGLSSDPVFGPAFDRQVVNGISHWNGTYEDELGTIVVTATVVDLPTPGVLYLQPAILESNVGGAAARGRNILFGDPNRIQSSYTWTHEFGHILGLGHTWNVGNGIMSYNPNSQIQPWEVRSLIDAYGD